MSWRPYLTRPQPWFPNWATRLYYLLTIPAMWLLVPIAKVRDK